jgi:hypothetical protein
LGRVITLPRYALAPPTFRFRAALAVADKLALGGEREVALATWLAARLLWDLGATGLDLDRVRPRAAAMRQWAQALALPSAARQVLGQLLDAAGRGDRATALDAWQRLLTHASRAVEVALRPERRALEERLTSVPDA